MNQWLALQIEKWLNDRLHVRLAEIADLSMLWPNHVQQLNPLVQNRIWDVVHMESQRPINHVIAMLDLEPEDQYVSDRG